MIQPEPVQTAANPKSPDEIRESGTPKVAVESSTLQHESVKVAAQETNGSSLDGFSIVALIIMFIGGISVAIMVGTAIYDHFDKSKPDQTKSYVSAPAASQQRAINETPTQIQPTEAPSDGDSSTGRYSASTSSNAKDSANSTVFKVYQGLYTFDTDGVIHADDFKLTVGSNQITYAKGEALKTFDVQYQGTITREPQPGIRFLYHKFLLLNKGEYLLVSDRKEVKHEGVFYYRIIIDGQVQLAL
ncbi:hypothetical protein ACFFGT_13185 [Mucilaginibacter angelicae]|uniref:Uncharacterized protein n=1 Tax=Mucilaginibacter angelicae TaxID=869718 RepID=A0ABV6L6S0_9SPHI